MSATQPNPPMETLTVTQAAALIGINRQAVMKRIRRGTLRARIMDGHWQIDRRDAERQTGKQTPGRKVAH